MNPNQVKLTSVPGVFQLPTPKPITTDITFKVPQMVPLEELQKRSPIMCTGEVPRNKTTSYSSFPQICLSKSIKDQLDKNKGKEILSISPDIYKPILPFPIITQPNAIFALAKTDEDTPFPTELLPNELARKKAYLDAIPMRKENKCEKCDKICKTPAALKAHMITHIDIKPFQCLQCQKFFKSENGAIAHLKIGHKLVGPEIGNIEQFYRKIPLEELAPIQEDISKLAKIKEAKKRLTEGGGKEGGVKRSRTNTPGGPGSELFNFSHGLPPSVKAALLADLAQEQSQEKKNIDKVVDPPAMDHNKQFGDLNWPCCVCETVLSFKHTFTIHMQHLHSMRVMCDTCKRVYRDENTLKQHCDAVHVN